jgi:hypothetical protein
MFVTYATSLPTGKYKNAHGLLFLVKVQGKII